MSDVARAKQLLKVASETVATLGKDNEELRMKLAEYEHRERARSIAQEMEEKGLSADQTMDEKIASILSHEDMSVVGEAVKLASHVNVLGSPSERASNGVNSKEALEAFVLTGEL